MKKYNHIVNREEMALPASTVNYNTKYVLLGKTGSSSGVVTLPSSNMITLATPSKTTYPLATFELIPKAATQGSVVHFGDELGIKWAYPSGYLGPTGGYCAPPLPAVPIFNPNSKSPFWFVMKDAASPTSSVAVREGVSFSLTTASGGHVLTYGHATAVGSQSLLGPPGPFLTYNCNASSPWCGLNPGWPVEHNTCSEAYITFQIVETDGTISKKCKSSADCPGGYVCVDGACTTANPPTPPSPGDNGTSTSSSSSKAITIAIIAAILGVVVIGVIMALKSKSHPRVIYRRV